MAELIDETTDQVHGDVGSRTEKEDRFEVCEPCNGDNIIQPATGWCETCDEMLCNDCYKSHCRPKMMKNHQLCTLEEMRNRQTTKKVESKCKKHDGKTLEYFCEDHAELGCSQCFVTKHRPCRKVVCLSEVKTRASNDFKTMQLLLSKLEERLIVIEEKKVRKVGITENQHDEAIAGIEETGEKLKSLIDTIVKEQLAKVEKIKEDNIRTIGKVDGMKKEVAEKLATARDMLDSVKRDNNQLFITMKHVQGEAKVLESKLGDIEHKTTIKEFEFVLNPELARLLETLTELGTLKDTEEINMEKATDEVVDEFDVQRFKKVCGGSWFTYDGKRSDAIQLSTDRDIRLMYVFLYPCYSCDIKVKLNIKEGSKCLISCTSIHARTVEDVVPVNVLGDGGVHGITLEAGHRYDVAVNITGGRSCLGTHGLSEVTALGVKFSFTNSLTPSKTTVMSGQIPGFRFKIL